MRGHQEWVIELPASQQPDCSRLQIHICGIDDHHLFWSYFPNSVKVIFRGCSTIQNRPSLQWLLGDSLRQQRTGGIITHHPIPNSEQKFSVHGRVLTIK